MDYLDTARGVIATEIETLQQMSNRLNGDFEKAVDTILNTQGRVVVVGMGKSGIVGKKIAATLASTGTPSFSVHPGEAFHGDLGMIRPIDVALMISNSGETEELIRLLPFLQYQENLVIAMTGKTTSTLARNANVTLDISAPHEACNHNLAPTSSTTATIAMGDALAVVLSTARGFQPEDFARFHPGGSLGRKLLTRISDVMRSRALPFCDHGSSFREVIQVITRGRLGLAIVMDRDKLCGVITDGDLRRAFESESASSTFTAADIMTKTPKTIKQSERLVAAEELMREEKIKELIVVDDDERVAGVLQIFDVDPAESGQ
ncbi:Arabinose 5-phosphate isomerase KpsF [Achromobacter spanius]|uniref:KpsF/GutQ family sugar-phosphate isomerase n=1 Tax=Achromobacter spanius TaxID=217203 RepID=UPI000C2CC3D3|nr:KpsF/GutQ family sugar-phosphate isomerase [Achromobacter spanius]AUA57979.1 KpsF/GutQ family sugar-phosphate isomerase [Achromobacter spanius]CAB3625602.1 Arabinose 5-phosphate isomerase KpsF [Achromobacter spanius]SPT42079.1 Arabinose 5-phosphate isomerase KpsF [Achromobacter denitrificans]VEE59962.1 Arabinose 5-phosphate isomerase KpsF [Achromobacter spanius]